MLNNKNYCLLIADSQDEWSKGLMNYRKPVNFDGMLFIFPDKDYRSFWNKNTYLDLDIYWLNNDKVEGKIILLSIDKSKQIIFVNSPKPVNKVIEIFK